MYFPDLKQTEIKIDSAGREAARKIYPGDRIVVQIVTMDDEVNKALNNLQKSSSEQGEGFLVDPSGFIEIPSLGKFFVKGQTPTLIREDIKGKLNLLYKDATVYCTMTGRVVLINNISQTGSAGSGAGASGVVSIPLRDERLTIPEVLSGISTTNVKLKKTWIIREVDGKRQVAKIDLNSAEILKSPFFYLRNNDVIYFEPRRFNRFLDANAPTRNLFGVVTGLSGLALALVLALK